MVDVKEVPNYDTTRNEMFESVLRRLRDPGTPICNSSIAMCHTALIEALHTTSTIRSVSDSAIEVIPFGSNGGKIPAIRQIESKLKQAFEERALLDSIACQSNAI